MWEQLINSTVSGPQCIDIDPRFQMVLDILGRCRMHHHSFRSWRPFIYQSIRHVQQVLVNRSFVFLTFVLVLRSLNQKKWLPSWKPTYPYLSHPVWHFWVVDMWPFLRPGRSSTSPSIPDHLDPWPSAAEEMIEGGQFSTRTRLTLQEDPCFFSNFLVGSGRMMSDSLIKHISLNRSSDWMCQSKWYVLIF